MTTLVRTGISVLLILVLAACSQNPLGEGVLDTQATENQKLTYPASDAQQNGYFGNDVAVEGDLLVVGAIGTRIGANYWQGAAYLYQKDSAGTWQFVKKLVAGDGAGGDSFGSSVSISGNTIVVGAYTEDSETYTNQGSAYIYERDQGGTNTWGQVKKLVARDGAQDDWFGFQVSISGDTVVVGAFGDDVGTNANQGSAYVFLRDQGGTNAWGEVKKLVARDGRKNNGFGSVAVSGDTIVVGAPSDRMGTGLSQGSAYIFSRNQDGTNNWGQLKKLRANDGSEVDFFNFGYSVAISGNTIVVGSPFKDTNSVSGSAYIYGRDQGGANNWGEVKKIVSSLATPNDNFGSSVAINGNWVVVSAPLDRYQRGAAYLFARNRGGTNAWGQVRGLVASDSKRFDEFGGGYSGGAVAISGNTIVVSISQDEIGSNYDQGSVNTYNY